MISTGDGAAAGAGAQGRTPSPIPADARSRPCSHRIPSEGSAAELRTVASFMAFSRPSPRLIAKRALGMRFAIEERTLRLLDRFVAANGVATLGEVTPSMVDEFLASRPRKSGSRP